MPREENNEDNFFFTIFKNKKSGELNVEKI